MSRTPDQRSEHDAAWVAHERRKWALLLLVPLAVLGIAAWLTVLAAGGDTRYGLEGFPVLAIMNLLIVSGPRFLRVVRDHRSSRQHQERAQ
jgi:hypothetical protein